MKVRLFVRKSCRIPTILGGMVILLTIALLVRLWLVTVYGFLSINEKVPAKTMVIEGWVSDTVLKQALEYYKANGFKRMIVTGTATIDRRIFATYDNTAPLASAMLKKMGFTDTVYTAAIPPQIRIDRTFNTAILVKMLFEEHPKWEKSFLIFTEGAHARRTKLMFDLVFGTDYHTGIIAGKETVFDPARFWRTSKGFRTVSNEFVAYLWVRLFFHPDVPVYEKRMKELLYREKILKERHKTNMEFADSATSPLEKKDLITFQSLKWFPVNPKWRIKAKAEIDTSGPVFKMATNTARKPEYRKYALLTFFINDTLCRLTAYQNMEYIHHPIYGKYLFVPFRDKTNGISTYAAGRYLDLPIPDSDSVIIDFNTAYNPYCAYAHRWSCPLVPFENHMPVAIFAGEKKYR